MITLKTLKWDNCFSYGEGNELDLANHKLVQVVGTNGVGKSSIPLILEEVLFNKNSKGVKKSDIANRNVNQGYAISIEFEKDEREYLVEVSRKASAKVQFFENGEDISSHTATNTYKTIQEILGLDFKTFSQIVYQNTNSSLQFLTATDTNRKKFLIDLLNLDYYIKLFDLFKAASKETTTNLETSRGRAQTIEKWLEKNKSRDTQVLPLLNFPPEPEENEEELRSLLVEIQNISQKNRKISENNQNKKILANINIGELKNSPYKETKPVSEFKTALGSAISIKKEAEKRLEKIESLDNICHTCEQKIDSQFKEQLIEIEKATIMEATQEIEDLHTSIKEVETHNTQVSRVLKQIQQWEQVYRSIDSELPAEILNKTELEEKADKIREALQLHAKEREKIQKENESRSAHNAKIAVLKEQTGEFETDLAILNKEITGLEQEATNLDILKKSFSTNGLVAYKIENLVKELEELTNQYLGELSDGRFTIEFVVSNDKLNVKVTDNEKIIDILALSSGELARVNTATLIAIRKLMSSISKSKINVLFLDEVINVLDESGREKLVEVLLKEELNTYLVSHGWTHPLLEKIEISKENNISRLEL